MPDEITPFELPNPLPTDATELQALEAQAVAAFQARHAAGVTTPEDMSELQALADAVRDVRAAIQATDQESEEEAQEEGEAEEQAEEQEQTEEAPAPEGEPAQEAPSAADAALDLLLLSPPAGTAKGDLVAPAPAATVSAPVSGQAPSPGSMAPTPAAPSSGVPASLAAGAGLPALSDTQLPVAAVNPLTIVASADIPGIPAASEIQGMSGLVAAIGAKARSLPNQPGSQYPVASIQKPYREDRNLDAISEREAMQRMGDLSSPAFLLASGGWCAPSETIYDFACEVESPPEMVVLPTFSTSRGGVRYPVSPTFRDFRALVNNGLFTWTEADDIAAATQPGGPEKPCFKIPCVTFDECRLELEGLCVTAGNLTDRAYPELIRRYMSLVLTGHLHRMNTQKILKMLATVDDTVVLAATFAAASAVLAGIELQVQDLRDQFSMSQGALVEAMAPRWLRGPIRADIARRECCSLEAVSDEQIRAYLQSAGIMLQFVSNWQELGDVDNPATEWPASVDILLWLPGALKELTGPTLDIAVARDSVLNATNDFTVAFTEESYQVCKQGCGVRLVTIPICPSGASGERVAMVCAEVSP